MKRFPLIFVLFCLILPLPRSLVAGEIARELRNAGWNRTIAAALEEKLQSGRPLLAVFDHDGTLMYGDLSGGDGEHQPGMLQMMIARGDILPEGMALVPPEWRHDPWGCFEAMRRDDANRAYMWRASLIAGYSRQRLQSLASRYYGEVFRHYLFPAMKQLVELLQRRGIEVWILSAGPEDLIRGCASYLGVPVERVLAQRFHCRDGIIQPQVDEPVSYAHGKVWYIENFIRPSRETELLVFGNSWSNDGPMLRYARRRGGLAVIVDPEERSLARVRRDGFLIQNFPRSRMKSLRFGPLH